MATVNKPSDTNPWDTNGTAIVQPDPTHISDGWAPQENPPAEFFNYTQNLNGCWFDWIDKHMDDSSLPSADSVLFRSDPASDGAGVRIESSDDTGAPLGGQVQLRAGTGTTTGGSISIIPQDLSDVPFPDFSGGAVSVAGGASGSNSGTAGDVLITGGPNQSGAGAGGLLLAGGGTGITGGLARFIGGTGSAAGGAAELLGGVSGGTTGGDVTVRAANGTDFGGAVSIESGSATNNGSPSTAGDVTITAGKGDKEAGRVIIVGGEKLDGTGGTDGGSVSVDGGNTPSGTGGVVTITGGSVTGTPTGDVVGGNATISGGDSDGTDQLAGGVHVRSGQSTGVAFAGIRFFTDDPQATSGTTQNAEAERMRMTTFGVELTDNFALVAESGVATTSAYNSIVLPFVPSGTVVTGNSRREPSG